MSKPEIRTWDLVTKDSGAPLQINLDDHGSAKENKGVGKSPLTRQEICDNPRLPPDTDPKNPDTDTSEAAANAALSPYPIRWHNPRCLVYLDVGLLKLYKRWTLSEHCICDEGEPMYFLKGKPYELWAPRLIRDRPPCCFRRALIWLTEGIIMIFDQCSNLLMAQKVDYIPSKVQNEDSVRTAEEMLMCFLTENIWWLAHEKCELLTLKYMTGTESWITTDYTTNLVLPMVGDRKTSLKSYVKLLSGVYKHVKFLMSSDNIPTVFSGGTVVPETIKSSPLEDGSGYLHLEFLDSRTRVPKPLNRLEWAKIFRQHKVIEQQTAGLRQEFNRQMKVIVQEDILPHIIVRRRGSTSDFIPFCQLDSVDLIYSVPIHALPLRPD